MRWKKIIVIMAVLTMVFSTINTFESIASSTDPSADTTTDTPAVYATIGGSGSHDGTSWKNSISIQNVIGLQTAWDRLPENGTLYLGSGNYGKQKLNINADKDGIGSNQFKKLAGVDTGAGKPVFEGDFTNEEAGNDTFIVVNDQASYIWIENIKILNYTTGVRTIGHSEGLRFYNLDLENSSDGFYLDGGAKKDPFSRVKDIIIDRCTSKNFKKSLTRFRNGICDVIVSNCFADAGGKEFWADDNFPMAYQITGNTPDVFEERITFVDCIAQNSWQEAGEDKYWNADGFNSERQSRDTTYIRCRSYNATDGGWDCKGFNPTLIDCISMGNKRNYRFWSEGQVTLINCLGAYAQTKGGIGTDCGFGIFGGLRDSTDTTGRGNAAIYNSTFYNNNGCQIRQEGGAITLYNCIIGTEDAADVILSQDNELYQNNSYQAYNTLEYVKGVSGEDPQIKAPSPDWFDGKSDSWNSLKFKGKLGYFYDPNRAPAIAPKTPAEYGATIADVTPAYDWAKDSIEFMIKNDYLPGRPDLKYGISTVFAPEINLTRAEFAAMLVRTLGLKSDKPEPFGDVPAEFIFANDIGIAKVLGIVKGSEDGNFSPMSEISRQDVMVMLSRALKTAGKLPKSYNANLTVLDKLIDKETISDYAKQDVANMAEKGIIKGGSDGTINALGNTTRAEGAVIGKRVFDLR